jgi:hypothetical protein
MDMLYKVDSILGEEVFDKYDCILHYGKGLHNDPEGQKTLDCEQSGVASESTSSGREI